MTRVNVLDEQDEAEMLERAIAMSLEVNENCEEGHQSITQSESGVFDSSKLPPCPLFRIV